MFCTGLYIFFYPFDWPVLGRISVSSYQFFLFFLFCSCSCTIIMLYKHHFLLLACEAVYMQLSVFNQALQPTHYRSETYDMYVMLSKSFFPRFTLRFSLCLYPCTPPPPPCILLPLFSLCRMFYLLSLLFCFLVNFFFFFTSFSFLSSISLSKFLFRRREGRY